MLFNRRRFLATAAQGALSATIGLGAARAMDFAPDDGPAALHFGPHEALVRVLRETPPDRLLPELVGRLKAGLELKTLVAAAALCNARAFGGEDYIGFHTLMAMSPALHMAAEMPENARALPVLKVLYRNGVRLNDVGSRDVLKTVPEKAEGNVRDAVRAKDVELAERRLASTSDPLNAALPQVMDAAEVHRVNLAWKSFELLDLVGRENALTMLRQSLHYGVRAENGARGGAWEAPRTLLPKLFDAHRLEGREAGAKTADDAWVEAMSRTVFDATPEGAAEAVAAALAEGYAPELLGEAISLAANQLALRDPGRPAAAESPGKPIGSTHGDSIGVHACDSANAWRNLAKAADARNRFACLIVGAWQAAYDRMSRGDLKNAPPLPIAYHVNQVKGTTPDALLKELDAALRDNLQAKAAAVVARYGQLGLPERPVFDALLSVAVDCDGALHAEKYYRTASEEFARTRPAFRWRQLIALARVSASEYGRPAAGVAEAKRLLNA